ncbi:histone H3 K4-specific methyltransferase SET7/9 family protein [Raphanus sativus]|uniref:Phosphatidylinositol 4-phosphate 5-kinase 5 n=1 Tax=Raphanus sativus TaxID=3726 RepID=A0A6J0KLT0_RAPSA|nr:phosphatidylinositol 4-phosphate 5-kinase 5 [Raphanus sativus]KAJ4879626.1 histone H3 K4-specific methyltransferase SET7/9 family protein [Raphanus sativus]
MEGQAKLTRTQSSLLRSPSIRSSFHSLTLIDSEVSHQTRDLEAGEKEEKQRRKPFGSSPRTGLNRINPGLAFVMVSLSFLSLSSFFLFLVISQTGELLTSENLLLALILVAVALFFASKNIALLNQTILAVKETTKSLAFHTKNRSKPVQWYIGDTETKPEKRIKPFVREGVQFYSNGDFYEGEFHRGRCNGNGVYYYFVRGRYEGDWVDGRYEGHGIESWARGSRYKGQYRQGLRHGYGVYRFYTGDCYSGEWFNGQSHGFGVQSCADGSSYVGESRFGVKHGLGSYHFRNGDRYAGEYFGDKIHGFGVYRFANGHCYEGAWHEGRKQGYGAYSFRTGDAKSGEWDSGKLVTFLDPTTSEPVRRAVQAARETAKKAVNRRRVDEQVSLAVAAANKAATAARVAAVKAVQNQMDGNFCQS